MYVDGKGTNKDEQKAIYWLEKAADQGHELAQSLLDELRDKSKFFKTKKDS